MRQLPEAPPSRASYLSRICAGGFPEIQQLTGPAQRRRWFDAYIRTVTGRDVPGISRIQHVAELPKLLAALAAMTGQQLVVTRLAEKVALSRQAVDSTYLPLLETVYMAVRLPAWSRNLLSRGTRHPKSYVADSGVAAHLLRVDEQSLADPMCAATDGLRDLLDASGGRLVRGVVLYTATRYSRSAIGWSRCRWLPCGCRRPENRASRARQRDLLADPAAAAYPPAPARARFRARHPAARPARPAGRPAPTPARPRSGPLRWPAPMHPARGPG